MRPVLAGQLAPAIGVTSPAMEHGTKDHTPLTERRRRAPRRSTPRATKEQLQEMIRTNVPGGYDLFEEMTGICPGTARALVATMAVPHIRLGKRLVRFLPADVRAWLEARKVVPLRKQSRDARNTVPTERRRATAR